VDNYQLVYCESVYIIIEVNPTLYMNINPILSMIKIYHSSATYMHGYTCRHSWDILVMHAGYTLKSMFFFIFSVTSSPFFEKQEKLNSKLTSLDFYTRFSFTAVRTTMTPGANSRGHVKFSTFLCFQEMDLESTRWDLVWSYSLVNSVCWHLYWLLQHNWCPCLRILQQSVS